MTSLPAPTRPPALVKHASLHVVPLRSTGILILVCTRVLCGHCQTVPENVPVWLIWQRLRPGEPELGRLYGVHKDSELFYHQYTTQFAQRCQWLAESAHTKFMFGIQARFLPPGRRTHVRFPTKGLIFPFLTIIPPCARI